MHHPKSSAIRFTRSPLATERTTHERGSVLLAALCFATVLAAAVGSYVTLCYRALELSTRTLHGTESLVLAEAAMEDALWALNKNDWSAWAIDGTTATRTIGGFSFAGGVTGRIEVRIANYNGSTGTQAITATGVIIRPDGSTITRTLTASATRAAMFVNAVAATTGTVRFTSAGTSSSIDSYESSLAPYSPAGAGYSAVICAGSRSTTNATVQLTNAQVHGYVSTRFTGPSYSTSATLKGPATPSTTRIDLGRISTSPYQPVFDIKSVAGSGTTLNMPANNTTLTIGDSGATTPALYYSNGINMTGSAKIIVQGPVRLVVSGALYIGLYGGTPSIEVKNSGSLEVFVSGDIAIYGNGIDNQSKLPHRVAIYGTNTQSAPDMNTPADFHGVIYTPRGDFKVWSNNGIFGSIVARNVTFSGNAPAIHYDVNLRKQVFSGIDIPFAISDWRESTNDT